MFNEKSKAVDNMASSVISNGGATAGVKGGGVFEVICRDKDGNVKWSAQSHNLVVNVGLQDMNTKYFSGSSYTAAWYVGLYGAGASNTPAAGDTMASHAGWTEDVNYSEATNSASPAAFTINGTTTIGGAFLTSNNTKSGTSGTLFSASDFSSPGDRSVVSGDSINVTYTFSLDAA